MSDADPMQVNAAIVDAISQSQRATLSQDRIRACGAGKAYLSVAESAAIAVQDATDMLRNMSTLATVSVGTAIARLLAGEADAMQALTAAQAIVTQATRDYVAICEAAARILDEFPSGGDEAGDRP